jgi:hypothetical protein
MIRRMGPCPMVLLSAALWALSSNACSRKAEKVPQSAATDSVKTPAGSPEAPTITLSVGQTTNLPGGPPIRFERVKSDSRCPIDVRCAWEGDAEADFSLGGTAFFAELHTSRRFPNATTFQGFQIQLVRLEPYPRKGRVITDAEYKAVLRVFRVP